MKKKKKYILLAIILVFALFTCFYGFSYAKYAANSVWNYYLSSKGFYLSSDYLDETPVKNVNNIWNGGQINFNLKNSLNDELVTNYNIDYDVTCTLNVEGTCKLNEEDDNKFTGTLSAEEKCVNSTDDGVDVTTLNKSECEIGGYNWKIGKTVSDLYFNIDTESDDVVATISIASRPYNKPLSGTFTLHRVHEVDDEVTLNYNENGRLVISNPSNTSKCKRLSWDPTKIIITSNKTSLNSFETDINGYINSTLIDINSKKSISYLFDKVDNTTVINNTSFTLTDDTGC